MFKITNFMKIRPVGAVLFRAYRQTLRRIDTTNLRVAVRRFANAPKNHYLLNLLSLVDLKRTICSQSHIVITNLKYKKHYLLYHLH